MLRVLPIIIVLAVGGLLGSLITLGTVERGEIDRSRPSISEIRDSSESEAIDEGTPVPAVARGIEFLEDSLLARAISEVESVEIGTRSGEITGRVLTLTGEPLAGAEITARPGARPDREEPETLEEKVREFIRDEQWREDLLSEATTDEDGRYRLTGISSESYRLSGKLKGYQLRPNGRGRDVKSGDVLDFTATPVAEIELTILRPDGSSADKVTVLIKRGNSTSTKRWTSEKRTIEVEPGLMTVIASYEETERGEAEDVTAELGVGATPVTIQMISRGAIRGRPLFAPEEIDSYATVYLLPAAMKSDPTPEDLTGAPHQTWVSRHDEFTFKDLDPGGYWIGAARGHSHEGHTPSMQYVEVADTLVQLDLDLPPLDTEGGIAVYSYSPQGTLLSDVRVSFEISTPQYTNSGFGSATRMKDGAMLLRPDENVENQLEQMQNSTLSVVAHHSSYGAERVEVTSSEGGTIEVRFRDPARAVITVVGYVGSELIGRVQVQLQPQSEGGNRGQQMYFGGYNSNDMKPDQNGDVKIGPLSPGAYDLVLSYIDTRRNRWSSGELSRQPVHLVSGENRLNVGLPPVYSVELIFPEGVDGGSVQIQPLGSDNPYGSRHEQFEGGSAVVEGLVEGEYTVRAWGGGIDNSGSMTIRVPSAPVVFDPPPVNAIAITISDPEGPLAQAGFESGDVIREINGQTFEGEEQLAMLGVFLQGAKEVTLTIERGGQEIELVVDPRGLMKGDPGGRFQPTSQ